MCRANRAVGPTLAAVETAASTSAALARLCRVCCSAAATATASVGDEAALLPQCALLIEVANALATKATYLPAWRECTAPPTTNAAIPYLWRHGACIRCKPMG